MATLGDIVQKTRELTHTDANSYPDSGTAPLPSMLVNVNLWYQKIVSMILEAQDAANWDDNRTGGSASSTKTNPIATRLLVAAQREYAFNTASWTILGKEGGSNLTTQTLLPLKIKRLDVTYDNKTWFRATPLDTGAFPYGLGSITQEDANFIKEAPQYDYKYNSLFLYPTAAASDVSAGAQMQVEFWRNIVPFTASDNGSNSDLASSTAVPGIDADFHFMIAYGAAYEVANAANLPQLQNIKDDLKDWEARIARAYGKRDLDTELQFGYGYDYEFGR